MRRPSHLEWPVEQVDFCCINNTDIFLFEFSDLHNRHSDVASCALQNDEKDKLRASLGNAIMVERPDVKASFLYRSSTLPPVSQHPC